VSFTYDSNDLGKHLNWIRLRIGDVDTTDQQIQDEEINAHLAVEPRPEFAAANVAEAIAVRYARVGAAVEAETYQALADAIRKEATPSYL